MKIKKFLVAGGNSTALVYDCPDAQREIVSKKLLKDVEQVGFISNTATGLPEMTMMGDELCINGTIAFASTLNERGKLVTSGLKESVSYITANGMTKIIFPMKFKKDKNIVLLEGMGFVLFEENVKSKITRSELSRYCDTYSMPAFGAVIYNKNNITPYIYVKKIDSFGKETACGSGSIAFSIFSGISDIIQPTGETISVRIGALIEISAKVKKYK